MGLIQNLQGQQPQQQLVAQMAAQLDPVGCTLGQPEVQAIEQGQHPAALCHDGLALCLVRRNGPTHGGVA